MESNTAVLKGDALILPKGSTVEFLSELVESTEVTLGHVPHILEKEMVKMF